LFVFLLNEIYCVSSCLSLIIGFADDSLDTTQRTMLYKYALYRPIMLMQTGLRLHRVGLWKRNKLMKTLKQKERDES